MFGGKKDYIYLNSLHFIFRLMFGGKKDYIYLNSLHFIFRLMACLVEKRILFI